ncbi:MAG: chemotaxis signal transduction protein CheV [Gammaproteobacteria bacterium]|nr:MAG: chemotaxis signal transduction protein CheV [Gammaproteobacteria bacterium]
MASVMEGVNQRTQLAGHNRLELLLFRLNGKQRFGINVFKVQEVIQCPPLTRVPKSHSMVRGVAHMRGKTIPVLDLSAAIGGRPLADCAGCYVIITEYNRSVQGFLVGGVERIINMKWQDILPPPKGSGANSYMTAVTNLDGELVEIIDVEKVLAEVSGIKMEVSQALVQDSAGKQANRNVLVVDDSGVARKQVARTLEQIGIACTVANDGREALEQLQRWAAEGAPITERLLMVISDIEMPEMDGYTLTTEIRRDERLKDLRVLLHSSLSGVFNTALVKKVGADQFLPKFSADELAKAVLGYLKAAA